MKEYKRLTTKLKGIDHNLLNCSVCPQKEGCVDLPNRDMCLRVAIDNLAELEDKIENGELFSIPFMYHNKKLNAYTVVYEDDDYEYLMGQVFRYENAKEEAEKFLEQKLKELKVQDEI